MTTIKDVTAYLETIAPPFLQENYDNAGLLVGNFSADITGILVALDCTEDVIDEAVRTNCNLVVVHHPVIFSGIKRLTGADYVQRTVIKAIRKDVAIYAIHTNLDNVYTGVNNKICERLGLENLKILAPKKNVLRKLVTFCPVDHTEKIRSALFGAGCGHIGNYDQCSFSATGTGTFRAMEGAKPFVGEKGQQHHEAETRIESIFPAMLESKIIAALIDAHPYEEVAYDIYPVENFNPSVGSGMIGELKNELAEMEFLALVRSGLKTNSIRHTRLLGKKVKRVAVCGGAGSFLLKDAIQSKADFFVTSDFKYHQFFDADGSIVIADIGHYESEQFTSELLKELLVRNFSTFAVRLTELVTNPVHYY